MSTLTENPTPFADVARLPTDADNVAIATRRLDAGTAVRYGDATFALSHAVMEGHRFALLPIAAGEPLLSWGLPFGVATRAIAAGEYVCNPKILNTLRHRQIDFELPAEPNFEDHIRAYDLDETGFTPAEQVAPVDVPGTFLGYARPGGRGAGTRNYIVLLGTSSLTGGFVRALETRLRDRADAHDNIDGIVSVAHTEGAEAEPNNRDLLLRTLAGFIVHSNTAAVLAVDSGSDAIDNDQLRDFMRANGYPLDHVRHGFFRVDTDFNRALDAAAEIVEAWLPEVAADTRSEQPLKHLKLALQCGGSDAFSGISGNPLAGWVAKELIRHGGSANLAETDELIGAEPYVLDKVRDLDTARRFLEKIATFKERAGWHGHSAEGNPSGGNQYRGLYNIVLKSIGAARKKDPEVRLDDVIDYGAPMVGPGYYFMDSPGNDLESIAGQVASGANLILFITGNGSITNFPFVPTLKFVTTTPRWQMLSNEMDVNAGRYQDGTPMDELGAETFRLARAVASGRRSLGEKAGHAQVSIWRNWRQTEAGHVEELLGALKPAGAALQTKPPATPPPELSFDARSGGDGAPVSDQVGLVVPTSLCSGQVARMLAERLNNKLSGPLSRYVALVHTEGCGAAGGYSQDLYLRTIRGHLRHPMVGRALLLEHGCEQTHNDAMQGYLRNSGVAIERFGWASVQLDGGIASVMDKAQRWFERAQDGVPGGRRRPVGLDNLRLGMTAVGAIDDDAALALARLAGWVVAAGGLVVIAENAALWNSRAFGDALLSAARMPTLGYGDAAGTRGLHIMETPTEHGVETLTGLAASGVEVILSHQHGPPLAAHPLVPLLQFSADSETATRFAGDFDLRLDDLGDTDAAARRLLERALETLSQRYTPRLLSGGNIDFQLTRGLLGLSL